jgi:hypothetical protein
VLAALRRIIVGATASAVPAVRLLVTLLPATLSRILLCCDQAFDLVGRLGGSAVLDQYSGDGRSRR